MIAQRFSIPHVSTGDIFRKNLKEGTPLGMKAKEYMSKGLLVPDETVVAIVKDRLDEKDCKRVSCLTVSRTSPGGCSGRGADRYGYEY